MTTREVKFCSECGEPVPVPNPPFCSQCGVRLANLASTSPYEFEPTLASTQTEATNDNTLEPVINDKDSYDVNNNDDNQIECDDYSDYYGLDEFFPLEEPNEPRYPDKLISAIEFLSTVPDPSILNQAVMTPLNHYAFPMGFEAGELLLYAEGIADSVINNYEYPQYEVIPEDYLFVKFKLNIVDTEVQSLRKTVKKYCPISISCIAICLIGLTGAMLSLGSGVVNGLLALCMIFGGFYGIIITPFWIHNYIKLRKYLPLEKKLRRILSYR